MTDCFPVTTCLACGGPNLTDYLNLGEQPPANSYTKVERLALPTFPLALNFCKSCSHSQLTHVVNPDLLFKDYLYVSGTTKTLDNHFCDYVPYILSKFSGKLPSVLEVGSNDGSLLKKFKDAGCEILGVDPAQRMADLAAENGVSTICEYFSAALIEKQFDVIIGNNVFAHNYSPKEFLSEMVKSLNLDGIISLEFPLFTNTVKSLDVGQIYHEHNSFFNLKSFSTLVSSLGLSIVDIVEFPEIHGGTCRFLLQRGGQDCEKFLNMLKTEKLQGFHEIKMYQDFAEQVTYNLGQLIKCIRVQRGFGYKLVGYGAAAKASTIINTVLGNVMPEYIVDNNDLKVGRFMPASGIPIVPFEKLAGEKQLAVIVFPGNFLKEIKERLRTILGKDSLVICVTPFVHVEDLYD